MFQPVTQRSVSCQNQWQRHVSVTQADSCQLTFYRCHLCLEHRTNIPSGILKIETAKMEAVKTPRRNSFLTFAVTVNILFSAVSIAFLIYKVRVLEEHVLQLQDDQRYHAEATKENERADLTHRNKRAVESLGMSKSCSSCHDACVHLFGLGASAKVLPCSFSLRVKLHG